MLGTNRTAFQCAEKYQSQLNDRLIRKQWTAEEDARLMYSIDQYQQGDYIPWRQVARCLDGRLRSQCQIRWERTLNPALRRGRWTEDEDKCLLQAVHKLGTRDWAKIAQELGNRTISQCRERYCTVLDSGIKMTEWSPQEDAILLAGIETFGLGQWSKIRCLLPGRTPAMCKNRHISLRRRAILQLTKRAAKKAMLERKRKLKEEKEARRREKRLAKKLKKRGKNMKNQENGSEIKSEQDSGAIEQKVEPIEEKPRRKRGRPRKQLDANNVDQKQQMINDLLKEEFESTGEEGVPFTLTITHDELLQGGKKNYRLLRHIERKTRVTEWYFNQHGSLPASGYISKDVMDFIDSQPLTISFTLRDKLEKIYQDQNDIHRIPLNMPKKCITIVDSKV